MTYPEFSVSFLLMSQLGSSIKFSMALFDLEILTERAISGSFFLFRPLWTLHHSFLTDTSSLISTVIVTGTNIRSMTHCCVLTHLDGHTESEWRRLWLSKLWRACLLHFYEMIWWALFYFVHGQSKFLSSKWVLVFWRVAYYSFQNLNCD